MSFVWQQPKKEQVLRGENKVKFVHVNIPWPHLASWDLHSLFLSPSFLSGLCSAASDSLTRVSAYPSSSLVLSLSPSLLILRSWPVSKPTGTKAGMTGCPTLSASPVPLHFSHGSDFMEFQDGDQKHFKGQDLKTGSVA